MCWFSTHNPFAIATGILVLVLLCCCYRWYSRFRHEQDARGEYRAVASQYANVAFNDTFDDDYSAEGDGGDDDDGWNEFVADEEADTRAKSEGRNKNYAVGSNGYKRSIEMSSVGKSRGDQKLSVEELNG
jgi:hypothetical protein